MANRTENTLPWITASGDIILAVSVVGILILMVLPLPTMLLDLLFSFNITFSLIILLVAMYIAKPLDLSAFPSILLVITLFRLALNISSTRIILLHGNEGGQAAGKVINAFGNFVVGGNYVVGAIVFLILVIINYIVITKGAGRIAEVAARFTLDAMPGKQMSIDADLNAGFIDDREARERRMLISRESEYYGSMDGANKFVKGDAIAGIIITLINIIGGLIIGVFQNSMSFSDAARTYTLLTVGDGLVTQIPALIISSSAGIIVTRAGAEMSMGSEITSQVLGQPRAIVITAGVLLGLGLVPGLPTMPFIVLSICAGSLGYILIRAEKAELEKERETEKIRPGAEVPGLSHELEKGLPPLDILAMEIGFGLIPLVDIEQDGELLERIRMIRRQIGNEIGIVIPAIHIQDNMQLKPGEYTILLKGNEIARGELMMKYLLAMNVGASAEKLDGIATKEPTYGLPAYWIKEKEKEKALSSGYTVVDLPTVLITHLSDVIRRHAEELLGRQEVRKLLDILKESHPALVDELIPDLMPVGGVGKVLRNLLREQIPIRDLVTILETLADWSVMFKDVDMLTEYVRQSLSRTITKMYQDPEGNIPLLTLDQKVENMVSEAVQQSDQGGFIALEPGVAQELVQNLGRSMAAFSKLNQQPVVICSARIRPHFKKLIERFIPDLVVLSYNEIAGNIKIQQLGSVGLSNAD